MTPTLRPVADSDLRLLLDWVNRPDSLANKLHTASPVAADRHRAWFRERRRDPDCLMWIVEIDGRPVGQIRLTPGERAHEVDIYIEPARRGQGVARVALRAAAERYWRRYPEGRLIARIRAHNCASLRAFAAAGYRRMADGEGHVVVELPRPAEPRHTS